MFKNPPGYISWPHAHFHALLKWAWLEKYSLLIFLVTSWNVSRWVFKQFRWFIIPFIISISLKHINLVVVEFKAKMKFFWKCFDFFNFFSFLTQNPIFFKFLHNFISFYVFQFWKYEKVSMYVFVPRFMRNLNFIISGTRALLRARHRHIVKKDKMWNFAS